MFSRKKILEFFKTNFKTLIKIGFGVFIIYWILWVMTPSIEMSKSEKDLIDSLNKQIQAIYLQQEKLDSSIAEYNNKIDLVDKDINKIKGQKVVIKEIHHEQINRAGNYTEPELDSFFSARYR